MDEKRSYAKEAGPDSGETLTDIAFAAIRSDIIAGKRQPDERLRIERLKDIYGIGPTPLREALQRLCADGLVVTQGNRGFSVAGLDQDEFSDLNTARIEIEKVALRLSITKGDDDWEGEVAAAAWKMARADATLKDGSGSLEIWERANANFHLAMIGACGSTWVLRVRQILNDQCARFRRTAVGLHRNERDLGAEHAAIASAVLARDVALACDLTERHFKATEAALREG
ncbi:MULTISPECIES: GntR family transcriptional regulator [unclassified Yoonia]|uniref:GntR family transcriptional regulator n=1 Tax=unclassified Yoonia TaxID=2629118 RepID=UPI002AFDD0EF|nr:MULTISPECIES: FCD domain-containing protein [unclassified Yoonia]